MSKRLQVVVAEEDLQRYERSAQAAGLTVSAWARQAMNTAERQTSSGDVEAKLAAIRRAAAHNGYPAVDIDQMLAEIDTRYKQDLPGLDGVIFVDSNILMYILGKDHPHKIDARRLVERFASERRRMVTSSEVFQEVLHRFVASGRRDEIELAFHTLEGIVDNVFSVRHEDVLAAKSLTHAHHRLSARDAVHAAVMRRNGVSQILSFDRGFDLLPGLKRIFE